ncbi:uncharacterized protein [Temnothorax nylanderi]|uniref:uncharacterized protein n=1 Tax=Temnothorax nylanderi TaxID=102681 RepID=UPI003A898147
MDPDLDDLELIKIVERQPCLYNKSTKTYKAMDKPAIWTQIGGLLTHPKTGEQAMKRGEFLRTQWSREHKRKREYIPSGSGASADTQEFRFYGEMSFSIPHYVPRPTRGNMSKIVVGPSSGDSTTSSTTVEVCDDSTCDFDYSSQLWNTNLVDHSSSDKSQSSQSPVGQVSPATRTAMQPGPARGNVLPAKTKFKSTAGAEVVVPPSDNFTKKRKSEIDLKMDKSLQFMEKVAKRMDNVFERKEEQSANLEVDAAINFIRASLKKRVKTENQYKCIRRIMEVIDGFSE